MVSNDFWWQWPCSSARFLVSPSGKLEPSGLGFARQEFLEQHRLPGKLLAMSVLIIAGISSRKPKMQLGSSPITGTPRETNGASAASVRSASRRASSTLPMARNVRPQHSGRVEPSTGLAR